MANKIVQLKDGDDNLYPIAVLDETGSTGTFTVKIPRLNNQVVTFSYLLINDGFLVANAQITGDTSSNTDTAYLAFDDSSAVSGLPFTPNYGFGFYYMNGIKTMSNGINKNVWTQNTGAEMSGKAIWFHIFLTK